MTTWADDAAAELEALGDSPTPVEARAVTDRYPNVDVLAALASRGGGGGGGGMTMLGPFTVDFDDPNVNQDAVELTGSDLAEGTILFRAWAVVTETWTASEAGSTHQLFIHLGSGNGVLTRYEGTPLALEHEGLELTGFVPAATDTTNFWSIQIVPAGGATMFVDIWAAAGNFTAGSVDIYALVQPS